MKASRKRVRIVVGFACVFSFAGCSSESTGVEDVAAADGAGSEAVETSEIAATSETGALSETTEEILETTGSSVLDQTMTRLDGSSQELSAYLGKVVLVVNVASECGLTPQYGGLQTLYESKREEGLVILGFPANNFGAQEPGTDDDIAQFCTQNYGITFPMFSKISVIGDDQHPLFAELSARTEEPRWNFTKYLIDRDGRVVGHFGPRTNPDDEQLVGRINELLDAG